MQKNIKSFKEKVLDIVRKIPKGKTMTYGEVAKCASRQGANSAARAVGNIMAKNFDPRVPCHRVIKSDGTFGDYNRGGMKKKMELLRSEGKIK